MAYVLLSDYKWSIYAWSWVTGDFLLNLTKEWLTLLRFMFFCSGSLLFHLPVKLYEPGPNEVLGLFLLILSTELLKGTLFFSVFLRLNSGLSSPLRSFLVSYYPWIYSYSFISVDLCIWMLCKYFCRFVCWETNRYFWGLTLSKMLNVRNYTICLDRGYSLCRSWNVRIQT